MHPHYYCYYDMAYVRCYVESVYSSADELPECVQSSNPQRTHSYCHRRRGASDVPFIKKTFSYVCS